MPLPDPADNLSRRIAKSQLRFRRHALSLKFGLHLGQISTVFINFGTNGIRAVCSGSPTIGDVQQRDFAVAQSGQGHNMLKNRAIRGGCVESNQEVLIHSASDDELPADTRSYPPTLSADNDAPSLVQ